MNTYIFNNVTLIHFVRCEDIFSRKNWRSREIFKCSNWQATQHCRILNTDWFKKIDRTRQNVKTDVVQNGMRENKRDSGLFPFHTVLRNRQDFASACTDSAHDCIMYSFCPLSIAGGQDLGMGYRCKTRLRSALEKNRTGGFSSRSCTPEIALDL